MRPGNRRAALGRQGFTLVEVLAAMVILAIGLLALEALGIGAARSVNTANRQSELAVVATGALEETIRQVKSDPAAAGNTGEVCGVDADSGYFVCTEIALVAADMARVVARAQKAEGDDLPFQISSYVFDPLLP